MIEKICYKCKNKKSILKQQKTSGGYIWKLVSQKLDR